MSLTSLSVALILAIAPDTDVMKAREVMTLAAGQLLFNSAAICLAFASAKRSSDAVRAASGKKAAQDWDDGNPVHRFVARFFGLRQTFSCTENLPGARPDTEVS
jgi:hypothetical protein